MRCAVAWAAVWLATSGAMASPALLMPGDRLAGGWLALEYERPWPGLAIRRGHVEAGLPLPGSVTLGARLSDLEAPTVRESAIGTWASWTPWAFVGMDRVEVQVGELEPERRIDFEFAGRSGRGPLAVGWTVRVEGVQSEAQVIWRQWWFAAGREGIEFSVMRRQTPWRENPAWDLALRFALSEGLDAGFAWRENEARVALRVRLQSSRLIAATVWSGVRAGGFVFRYEAGQP